MFGAHGLTTKGPCMYEEITRIPLLMRLPGNDHEGAVNGDLVSHLDLLPTLLSAAGAPVCPILPGRNLLPRIQAGVPLEREAVMIEFNRFEVDHDSIGGLLPIRAWVEGQLKLAVNLLDTDELYDLATDPAELHNRIDDPAYAEARDRMHDALLEHMYTVRDPFRGPPWERRAWRTTHRHNFGWRGLCRPRPDDGFTPAALDYRTGKPAKGIRQN